MRRVALCPFYSLCGVSPALRLLSDVRRAHLAAPPAAASPPPSRAPLWAGDGSARCMVFQESRGERVAWVASSAFRPYPQSTVLRLCGARAVTLGIVGEDREACSVCTLTTLAAGGV